MKWEIEIPAFVFKPITSSNITTETIIRQDDVLKIHFPVFDKEDVLKFTERLARRKRKAHDRPIDELIEILDIVGANWLDPNYEYRKEAMEIIPMITGQSRRLCELELNGSIQLYNRKIIEAFLTNEIGGKIFLEQWVPRGTIKLHAQPRGLVYHNLAGNTFNVGLVSLYYGLISKNVNLIKLPHEEPYFAVRLAQSIAEVDKKLGREIAVLYWSGRRGDIFDELFASGNVDAIIGWGGLRSIEDIRRRAYHYGIKILDHGPKLSFSIISDEILGDVELMKKVAQKIAIDVVFWNQKACLSPRVIYILERSSQDRRYSWSNKSKEEIRKEILQSIGDIPYFSNGKKELDKNQEKSPSRTQRDELISLMKQSVKFLRDEVSDLSPYGFAKIMANAMEMANQMLPRAHLTQDDGMEMLKKREYFTLNYEIFKDAELITPPSNKLDWTVVYMRNPPMLQDIQLCFNRFLIVTRLPNIEDLIYTIQKYNLKIYLQTISIYGSNEFVENVAEEFSLIGACRFPRAGEHNIQSFGAPWDGHFILQNLVRWAFIGFQSQERSKEEEEMVLDLKFKSED